MAAFSLGTSSDASKSQVLLFAGGVAIGSIAAAGAAYALSKYYSSRDNEPGSRPRRSFSRSTSNSFYRRNSSATRPSSPPHRVPRDSTALGKLFVPKRGTYSEDIPANGNSKRVITTNRIGQRGSLAVVSLSRSHFAAPKQCSCSLGQTHCYELQLLLAMYH